MYTWYSLHPLCVKNLSWVIDSRMENHLDSDNNCKHCKSKISKRCIQGMTYNVLLVFSVGDTTRAVYKWYWARIVELVTLNIIFNVIFSSKTMPCRRHPTLSFLDVGPSFQCPRLKPSYDFHFVGSRISAFQLKGLFKSKTPIQEYRNEIRNSYQTCARIMWYMFQVQCEESRSNHLSHSTSCIDNALCLLVLVLGRVYWGLQVTSSFSIWNCVLRVGLRKVYFEGPLRIWRTLKTSILNIASFM